MKLSRLLIAALIAPVGIGAAAHAQSVQVPAFGTVQALLNTAGTTPSGGKVGTVQYSASTGSSNNFAVGTSTGLGVNASASSTQDYGVSSTAKMNTDGSILKQTIGTSGVSDLSSSFGSSASTYAQSKVTETYGSDYAAYSAMSSSSKATNANGVAYSEAEYDLARSNAVTSYTNSYNNSKAFSDSKNGVISGSFTQAADAGIITKSSELSSLDSTGALLTGSARTGSTVATDRTVETTSQTKGSSASNNVTVAGIGNAANIQSTSGSTFATTVTTRGPAASLGASNSATANGGAGASLNSTATANSSATSFTSTFLQSF